MLNEACADGAHFTRHPHHPALCTRHVITCACCNDSPAPNLPPFYGRRARDDPHGPPLPPNVQAAHTCSPRTNNSPARNPLHFPPHTNQIKRPFPSLQTLSPAVFTFVPDSLQRTHVCHLANAVPLHPRAPAPHPRLPLHTQLPPAAPRALHEAAAGISRGQWQLWGQGSG